MRGKIRDFEKKVGKINIFLFAYLVYHRFKIFRFLLDFPKFSFFFPKTFLGISKMDKKNVQNRFSQKSFGKN